MVHNYYKIDPAQIISKHFDIIDLLGLFYTMFYFLEIDMILTAINHR